MVCILLYDGKRRHKILGLPDPIADWKKIGLAVVELVASTFCFWKATAAHYKASLAAHDTGTEPKGSLREALFKKPSARVTWLSALFLLGYVGIEVALGGWIVVFMINVRGGDEFDSGMTATGFWLGIAIGRLVLGFVTPRIGEYKAISVSGPGPENLSQPP